MNKFNAKDYWDDRLTKSFSLEGVGYLSLGYNYNQWLYRVRRGIFLRLIRELAADFSDLRILDVGSGIGFYVELWSQLGVQHITGLDISPYAISKLRTKFPIYQFEEIDLGAEGAASDAALFEGNYDFVTALDVLFHILEDDKYHRCLRRIAQTLKPGGYFMFSENFIHGSRIITTHQVSRSIDTITEALTLAGFTEIKREPMFFLMNAPVDTNSKFAGVYWNAISRLIRSHEAVGNIVGSILFPIETILARNMHEGPSTEVMICRKSY